MKNEKYHTKQKDTLLSLFKSNPEKCFTSREIISDGSIQMGEATVYRLLSQFVKEDIVRKFKSENGSLYQLNACHGCSHFHMKCMECGELFHIDSPELKKVEDSLAESYGFTVDNSSTTLYGYCRKCGKEHT